MASGTISLYSSSDRVKGRVVWSSTQSIADNCSTITAKIQVARTSSGSITGTWTGWATSTNLDKNFSVSASVSSSWVTLKSYTFTVYHNSTTGYGSCKFAVLINGPTGSVIEGEIITNNSRDGDTMYLGTIPRAAEITSAPNFNDEESPTVYYKNTAGNAVSKLEMCITVVGTADDIAYREISKTGTSYTFNLTDAERRTLRGKTYGANERSVGFYLKTTFSEGTILYSKVWRTFTVINATPTLSPVVKDINPITLGLTQNENVLVKGYSNASFVSNATAYKNSGIKSQSVVCGLVTSTEGSGTFNAINDKVFTFTATDTRNNTVTQTVTKGFVDYFPVTCNQEVTVSLAGSTEVAMVLTITGKYFDGKFGGGLNNELILEVRHTQKDGTMGDWVVLTEGLIPNFNNNTYSMTVNVSGELPYDIAYTFQCRATDKLSSATTGEYTVKATPVFDWSADDFNFNVPVNINADEVKMNNETVLRHSTETNNVVLSGSGGHIYLRPGGTNDTSGETIFYADGSIKFGGDIDLSAMMSDYVVEQGTASMGSNGTWYWSKWKSGKAECYGCRNYGNMAITTAWGGLYRSGSFDQTLPSGLFIATPDVIDIKLRNAGIGGWVAHHENSAPSKTQTGGFIVVRPASATASQTYLSFNIIGRWK